MDGMDQSTFNHSRHKYVQGCNATELHTLDIWVPNPSSDKTRTIKRWVVYIHGGAWRDPEIDSMSFVPALEILLASGSPIAGFASINYRLSPYPHHPRKPSFPDDPSRNARHPDHVFDVSRALAFLEELHSIGNGYVLAGHSCGATIAFQIKEQCREFKVPLPGCIIGSEGIYDLTALVEANTHPAYRQFVSGAFGSDEATWTEASPYSSKEPVAWESAKVIVISHSNDDELVSKAQPDMMMERIRGTAKGHAKLQYVPVEGGHDEVWQTGRELARVIEKGLALLGSI